MHNYSRMYLYCPHGVKMGATTPIDEIWRGGEGGYPVSMITSHIY